MLSALIVRRGAELDLRAVADLLNEIIAAGGTTALTEPLSRQQVWDWLSADAGKSVWHVAEIDGDILGFQWIGPFANLPPEACEIGTFVKQGKTGLGIGSALFEATKGAARAMGYTWINAIIRADNTGGLIYYQSRGFRPYDRTKAVKLGNGQVVDKIAKRFDLE